MTEVALARAKTAAATSETDGAAALLSRGLDVAVGLTLLILLMPIMLVVAMAIYIDDGGAILFAQPRVGRGGRLFRCLKFRSMNMRAEAQLERVLARDPQARAEWLAVRKIRRDPRVTRVGAFIRKRSLDELPQFINVVWGQMSLVGPRPIVEPEIPRYGRRIEAYCCVRPGLTGLWQINGRSDASYRSRVAMDVVYARSKRPSLDLRILAATVGVVLKGRGSY